MDNAAEGRVDAVLRDARAHVDAIDAECLLAHALGHSRTWLYTHGDAVVHSAARAQYAALVQRRAAGEPVAYLTGIRGFWSVGLQVTSDTLIPRPETELLVELALARLPVDRDVRVADLGTGSGAIALALATERKRAVVVATDASTAALAVAGCNADALGIQSIAFAPGDWCQALGAARFDLIASNPPYLADTDPHRWAGDLRFEPVAALVSGSDGLDALRTIVRDAPAHLLTGGWLLLEHGWEQGEAVRQLMGDAGFVDVATEQDLEYRDRVTLGRICR